MTEPSEELPAPRVQTRSESAWSPHIELFAISFVALFLELMMIRWAPSVVRLVAYYANLMLISSFLGLGAGALLARIRRDLLPLFPVFLAANVGLLLLVRNVALPASDSEKRFYADAGQLTNWLALAAIFILNAAVFVPLGQRIGRLFERMAPLRAYAWDLGGSLAGTVSFGVFSLFLFSPMVGLTIVMLLMLTIVARSTRPWAVLIFAATLWGAWGANDVNAKWSPYYYITIREAANAKFVNERSPALREAPPGVRTMMDPPEFVVSVNHDFYQLDATLDAARFAPEHQARVRSLREAYDLPYLIAPKHDRVLVLGSGGGMDTQAAVLNGASRVDAVEIDPVLIRLSKEFNPSGIYDDPKVHVYQDDARAFLQRTDSKYDMVVFGWLDSQALFSYMSSLRLDGYVYTTESFRRAHELLDDNGTLCLSFVVSREWLLFKVVGMVREATGREPIVYVSGANVILCVPNQVAAAAPLVSGSWQRWQPPSDFDWSMVDLASDDWPYLYLNGRTIPTDYLAMIGILLTLSVVALLAVRGTSFTSLDGHFLFLGLGFLLLQTKGISDCSLYFGTTWVVTTIIVAGVLLMVLAANLLAMRMSRFSPWLYVPVIASVLLLFVVPKHWVLSLPLIGRLAWALLIVPLPMFFAGLIFSTTLRGAKNAAALLGANLIGAMLGGFCEYLGMAVGHDALTLVAVVAYLGSLLLVLRAGRAPLLS